MENSPSYGLGTLVSMTVGTALSISVGYSSIVDGSSVMHHERSIPVIYRLARFGCVIARGLFPG